MNQKNYDKFVACYKVILSLAPFYNDTNSEAERAFMETTVGAAIFYLPSAKAVHFTGMISEEVACGGKSSQEHLYPRKVSGRALLMDPPATFDEFVSLCNNKYLRYNLTTKAENKRLVPFQKVDVFVSPEQSYAHAGIVLVTV
jgi:hypothetical protein